MEKVSLTWQAPEYNHYDRTPDWFWAVGIIAVSIAILAFVYHNALFGILILLSTGILVFYTLREPDMVNYEINQRGVTVGKDLHPYLTIESFWVETRGGEPKVILKSISSSRFTKKVLMTFLMSSASLSKKKNFKNLRHTK
jgi:hypothetical protein